MTVDFRRIPCSGKNTSRDGKPCSFPSTIQETRQRRAGQSNVLGKPLDRSNIAKPRRETIQHRSSAATHSLSQTTCPGVRCDARHHVVLGQSSKIGSWWFHYWREYTSTWICECGGNWFSGIDQFPCRCETCGGITSTNVFQQEDPGTVGFEVEGGLSAASEGNDEL